MMTGFSAILNAFTRWRLWALLPLLVLALDFLQFPFVYHTEKVGSVPSEVELIQARQAYLGRFRGHEITVSYGSLDDLDYMRAVGSGQSSRLGVVVSHFTAISGLATSQGATGRALQALFQQVSPELAGHFRNSLVETNRLSAGHVEVFPVALPNQEPVTEIPVRTVFVVLLNSNGLPPENLGHIAAGLAEAFKRAASSETDPLLVTALATDPTGALSILPIELFETFFGAIPLGKMPRRIELTFYENWPNAFLRDMTTTLNKVWDIETGGAFPQRLFKSEFRLSMLFLCLCLLACSFAASLTLKNSLIISIAYLGIMLGGVSKVAFIFTAYDSEMVFLGTLIFMIVLALFFPAIARWDPKGLFSKQVGPR